VPIPVPRSERRVHSVGVVYMDVVVVEIVYADDNATTIFRLNVRAGFVYKNNQRRLSNYLPGMQKLEKIFQSIYYYYSNKDAHTHPNIPEYHFACTCAPLYSITRNFITMFSETIF